MKKIYLMMICVCMTLSVSGQSVDENAIELPEVTTEVGGDSLKAGLDSIPDYRRIVPDAKTGGIQLPKLDGRDSDSEKTVVYSAGETNGKDVYAEGSIGGGFPFYFLGDFSIYRIQNRPFELHFKHESTEGFGGEKASQGFFNRQTGISAKKYNKDKSGEYEVQAFYETSDDGLQNASCVLNDQVKHTVGGMAQRTSRFAGDYFLSYGINSSWYNRYSGLAKDADQALAAGSGKDIIQEKSSVFWIDPALTFGIENKQFRAAVSLEYSSQLNLGDSNGFVKSSGSSSAQASHRGSLGIEWKNSFVAFDGKIVAGSATGKNSVLFPFSLSMDFPAADWNWTDWPAVKVQGGLQSEQKLAGELESAYKYSYINTIPVETSDWFGSVCVTVPVSKVLTVTGGFDYRKTAFGNGVWEPDYNGSRSDDYQLYEFAVTEREEIDSLASVDFAWNDFVFAGTWEAFWKDVPALKDQQNFTAAARYNGSGSAWNGIAKFRWGLGDGSDKVPEIDAMAGWKVSKSVNLALETNDIVKLITKETRNYCGSRYAQKSGNVALVARFQF